VVDRKRHNMNQHYHNELAIDFHHIKDFAKL